MITPPGLQKPAPERPGSLLPLNIAVPFCQEGEKPWTTTPAGGRNYLPTKTYVVRFALNLSGHKVGLIGTLKNIIPMWIRDLLPHPREVEGITLLAWPGRAMVAAHTPASIALDRQGKAPIPVSGSRSVPGSTTSPGSETSSVAHKGLT